MTLNLTVFILGPQLEEQLLHTWNITQSVAERKERGQSHMMALKVLFRYITYLFTHVSLAKISHLARFDIDLHMEGIF